MTFTGICISGENLGQINHQSEYFIVHVEFDSIASCQASFLRRESLGLEASVMHDCRSLFDSQGSNYYISNGGHKIIIEAFKLQTVNSRPCRPY